MKFKYVRFNRIGFVLWPMSDELFHVHIARVVERETNDFAVSAGFVDINGAVIRCYGRSESLGMTSMDEDSDRLRLQFGLSVPD